MMICIENLEKNNSLNIVITDQAKNNFERLRNQIFKLLPNREEGVDWVRPLDTIVVEVCGMYKIFTQQQDLIFSLLCKLEGLYELTDYDSFGLFRRTIFECLNLLTELEKRC